MLQVFFWEFRVALVLLSRLCFEACLTGSDGIKERIELICGVGALFSSQPTLHTFRDAPHIASTWRHYAVRAIL